VVEYLGMWQGALLLRRGNSYFQQSDDGALVHDVRLIPLIDIKPFVKRQKNDAADAAAIAEAAVRLNLDYVAVRMPSIRPMP
jgi:hypothetical protein